MKMEDLRNKIIPTTIGNTDEFEEMGNKEFDTTDLIYLDSYDEQYDGKKTDEERRISATDYAQMNNAYVNKKYETRTGKSAAWALLRSACGKENVYGVDVDGDWHYVYTNTNFAGLCPSLHYNLSSEDEFDIREVKDRRGEIIYHTLQIGEYPKTKVNESLNDTLELLYHGGKIKEGISATGRWYSCNGQKEGYKDYAGKHSPEFEYQGNRYVRVISDLNNNGDSAITEQAETARWVKVEPISFEIKNWDEMPKNINPKGTGKAKYFDLRAEEVITANIPFYPDGRNRKSNMWQNSCVRGFFNGIDVRNITQNGEPEYGAEKGGNFTGECNFLNEAFNLSRQPIIEYTIPDSETEIPDDAFNGCISLKKIVMHSGIKTIGKRAFDGLDFKYAYKTETGELVFSQELPKNKEEYTDVVELEKITESLVGFDYGILLQSEKINEIANLSETLSKNKFSIPYSYGLALTESKEDKAFCENSKFKFFKSEIPNINDMLLDFTEEERRNFFKFANSLGCFSTEKMLDKKGKETQVFLAQKASSLLAQLLKTDEMKLRQISQII